MFLYQEICGAPSIDTILALANNHPFQIAILTVSSISLTGFNHYTICTESLKPQPPSKYNEGMDSNACKKWIEKMR